jgi:hypothetical protein
MQARWIIIGIALLLSMAGCSDNGNASNSGNGGVSGQITRPGDLGLPLDNPDSVAAFDVADRFLVSWFLLEDPDKALDKVHPNVREFWRPVIEDTEIIRTCSLLQVEGTTPDASGTVQARYALGGCKVTAPGGSTAVYINLTITSGDDDIWVSQIEFLR